MRKKFLQFSPPLIGNEEIDEVVDTLRSDWITTGPKVKRFEREFAALVGAPAALATSSGTDAMLVGLASLGIGSGDFVITTPLTFCSTVHVIEHLGARPILVDVEQDSLNISAEKLAKTIEQAGNTTEICKLRAVIPVHLYGHPCDMDSIREIALQYKLYLLEDAAHALPAKYKGRMIGSPVLCSTLGTVGSLTAFSFYATKNVTTGEGGMLTGDGDLIESARIWSLHGMSRDAYERYEAKGSWRYDVILPGFKCNMTDIQAAMGLHQIRRLSELQKRRSRIVHRYTEVFERLPELEVPREKRDVESAWHLYVIRLNLNQLKIDRAQFISELKARNIGTSVHFIPIHLTKYYRIKYGYQPNDFPVAFNEYKRLVSLPLNPRMADEDVEDVIEAVTDVVEKHRR